jgi:hypothetical protein
MLWDAVIYKPPTRPRYVQSFPVIKASNAIKCPEVQSVGDIRLRSGLLVSDHSGYDQELKLVRGRALGCFTIT